MRAALLSLMLLLAAVLPGAAAPALDLGASSITAEGRGANKALTLDLAFGARPGFRTMILDAPPRLVLDITDADFAGADPAALPGRELVKALRWGAAGEGVARLVAELPGPMRLDTAETRPDGHLRLRLAPVAAEDFRPDGTGAALHEVWNLPKGALLPHPAARRPGPLRVTLDPGHGGLDPGAEAGGLREAQLMAGIAQEVAAALRARGVEVSLTRQDDSFIPLERRIQLARAAGADLLISLHADVLPAGQAAGAAVFVWNPAGADAAARALAASHDRDELLAGLAPDAAGSDVAGALMDLARLDSLPRAENMARFLVSRFALGALAIHKHPVKGADFAVLRAPDIPSVLIETGFLTDPADRANLGDPAWRARLAGAIAEAVIGWAEDDAARLPLLRH